MLRRNNGRNNRSPFTTPKNPRKSETSDALKEEIQKRAYELYEQRGRLDGYDLENWLEAEKLVRSDRT